MSAITLSTVVADLDRLPALPEVVQDLLDYLQRPDVEVGQVAQRIARDPALAARLLRVANSSFYGLQTQVATIPDALVVLGLRAARTLVTGAALVAHFQTLAAGEEQHAFWLHSAGCALCARVLARQAGVDTESAFTAALLHDIGRLILTARFPLESRRVAACRAAHDCHPIDAEHEVLGFDHAQIGAALAALWKFPAEIAAAIAGHHSPEDQARDSLASLVHVADVMAHALEFPGGEDDLVPPLSTVAWNRLGISWDEFRRLLGEVDAQREDAERALS